MPAKKRIDHPTLYCSVSTQTKEDNNNCAPIAVSIVTGRSLEEVTAKMESFGRIKKQGTHRDITEKTLTAFGVKVREWKRSEINDLIASYPLPHCNVLKNVSSHHPRRFPDAWAPHIGKTLLLFSAKHVAAFKSGSVQDWSINNQLQIREIWELEVTPAPEHIAPVDLDRPEDEPVPMAPVHLDEIGGSDLVRLLNEAIDNHSLPINPVKRFASAGAGRKRIEKLMAEYGLELLLVNDGPALVSKG